MRNVFIITLLICLSLVGNAQQFNISEKEEISLRADNFAVIGKCRDYIAAYRNHQDIGEVIFYDKKMQKRKITTLTFLPANLRQIHFCNQADKLMVFYQYKENKRLKVFMSRLKEDYSWTEPVLLDEGPAQSYRAGDEGQFVDCADGSKTLWYYAAFESNATVLRAKVINQELNIEWQLVQPLNLDGINIQDVAVLSNKGRAFILGGEDKSARYSTEKMVLCSAGQGYNGFMIDTLPLDGHAVRDVNMLFDEKRQIINLCAFFSNGLYKSAKGLYVSAFDADRLEMLATHYTPIVLQSASSNLDLQDLIIRHLFLKQGGEMQIAAERSYQQVRSISTVSPMLSSSFMMSNMGDQVRNVTEYFFDDIVLFDLKTDGALTWSQSLIKEQMTTDDQGIYSSFGVLQHRLGNAFIFNDLSNKQSRFLACYVSGNGELTIRELQTSEAIEEWNLMPRSGIQVSKSEFVMPCVSKGYLCFLKISY